MSSQKSTADLSVVLKRYLFLIPDARQISISTIEGAELLSESRDATTTWEDSQIIASLAPSFSTTVEHSSRLGLGSSLYTTTWAANSIVLQTKLDTLIVSILLDSNGNIGVAEEHVSSLRSILAPFGGFDASS